jgi:MFS family permease
MMNSNTKSQISLLKNHPSIGWVMFWITTGFYFYDFLLRWIPSVMMEEIIATYSVSPQQFGLLESSFYYMYTPMQLFAGPLIDEYGASKIVPLAVLCCLIGSVMSAMEINFTVLLLARLLIGFGSAFAFIAVLKTASEWLPRDYYPILCGVATGLGSLGGIAAETLIPMTIHLGAPFIYGASAVTSLILFFFACVFIFDREDHSEAAFDIQLILQDIYRVISSPQLWLVGLIGCFMYTPLQLFITWAKSFFMQNYHISELLAGQITSMLFWGMVIGAPINGWLASQMDNKKNLLFIGSICACAGMSLLLLQTWSVVTASIILFMVGFFIGAQQLVFVFAKDLFPLHLTATSVACANMIVNLSSYIQPMIGQALTLDPESQTIYSFASWQTALAVVPVLLLLSSIIVYFIEETEQEESE